MSAIPTEWGEPDSRLGVYYELLWIGLAVVVLAALAYWEPFSITVSITPQRLAGATILGVVLGIAVMYVSFVNERFQRLWADFRIRFISLFVLIMGGQLGLAVAPTWTVLTMLATFLTLIPLRLAIYLRTR
ncbi:hypothetical protein SAMN05192561_105101 [Halopenitus malekzadehii]|uniref:Uncharacterized protein n=1 Tax=Halopenitus malekzadehii TaxID=1267564 RepID=A0A1H6J117_9EURY|nr:hypothetical protein [Halopenitus malekzadehii]SEH53803.1 hypothetical protein SAMN05192561_105101 [Halopenitus malekzadehii]